MKGGEGDGARGSEQHKAVIIGGGTRCRRRFSRRWKVRDRARRGLEAMDRRRVLIVGGGIAGLALAPMLARIGVAVEVIERAPVWGPAGTGIYVPGNAARAHPSRCRAHANGGLPPAAPPVETQGDAVASARNHDVPRQSLTDNEPPRGLKTTPPSPSTPIRALAQRTTAAAGRPRRVRAARHRPRGAARRARRRQGRPQRRAAPSSSARRPDRLATTWVIARIAARIT